MAISSEQITVDDTATALNASSDSSQTLFIRNTGGHAVDLGGSAVVATEGFSLADGEDITLHLKPGDVVYAIRSASDDSALNVFRT